MSAVAKKKAAAVDADLLGEEEEVVSDNENEDDITNNAMIKVRTIFIFIEFCVFTTFYV